MENVREMRNKLTSLKSEIEKIHTDAGVNPLTEEKQKEYDNKVSEAKELRSKIDAIEANKDRSEEIGKIFSEARQLPQVEVDDRNEYRKAFISYLKTGELRTDPTYGQSTLVVGDGGALVPEDWAKQIIHAATKEQGIGANSRQEVTGSNEKRIMVRSTLPTAAYADENGTHVSGNVGANFTKTVFDEVVINLHKATAVIPVTSEMLSDSYFNFENEIINAGKEALAELTGTWFATGTGTKQPYGVFASVTPVESATASTIALADLYKVKNDVKNTYRKSSKWYMNDATLAILEAINDGVGNSIIQERSNGEYWLLNRQIVIDEFAPDKADNALPILFGDLSRANCVVTKANGLEVKINPYRDMDNDVTEYYFTFRVGSKLVLPEAVTALKIKAAG